MKQADQLVEVLMDPSRMSEMELSEWNELLSIARRCRVLARLGYDAKDLGIFDKLPKGAQEQMLAAIVTHQNLERALRWEVDRLTYALRDTGLPIVVLKGAAYVYGDMPNARGREVSDVDLLFTHEDLVTVEQTLIAAGWEHAKLHAYDQNYYRAWMHELPPMAHPHRQMCADLHHNILPLTGRLHPDAEKLHAGLVALPEGRFRLSDADVCLHCAAHLFQDGEVAGALRDLLDCHELLTHFAKQYAERGEDFWAQLIERAQAMDLVRPMIYAIKCTELIFKTDVPENVLGWCKQKGPSEEVMKMMLGLVRYAIMPSHPLMPSMKQDLARLVLYARSHWLKMPPLMLAKHLMHKGWRGLRPVKEEV